MKKEQQSEVIHDALGMLDDDMIEEVARLRGHVAETVTEKKEHIDGAKKSPIRWRRWTALAASVCLLVIGSWAWDNYLNIENSSDCNDEGICESENDKDAVQEGDIETLGTESIPLDSNAESVDGVEPEGNKGNAAEQQKPEQMEPDHEDSEVQKPSDSMPEMEEMEETLLPLGDKFHLKENYVRVSILPAKVWGDNVVGESVTSYLSQAVTIKEEYWEDMDELIGNMCEVRCFPSALVEQSDKDMVYHIFFERNDGAIIHCWLLEDGYMYYHDYDEVYMKLDKEVYDNIFKILAMHW